MEPATAEELTLEQKEELLERLEAIRQGPGDRSTQYLGWTLSFAVRRQPGKKPKQV
jgi:hypothetical protein|tara:strand:- start:383 stop:550 length:168 start_codon:yes stop_codon:yes gene_type:complete